MGTTLTSLQAGSTSYAYTVAIQGYRYLLTSADAGAGLLAYTNGWTLTGAGGPDTGWGNNGAASVETIAGDGYVEWTMTEIGTFRMIGLSTTDANQGYTTIHYAFYMRATEAQVYESGVPKHGTDTGGAAGPTIAAGDTLRVERAGTVITYSVNGAVFYTSLTASTGPLLVDAAMDSNATTIGGVNLVDNGRPVQLSWQNVTNCTTTTTSGTDWTSCLGGLFVDAQHEQHINPWEPFGSGGKCVLKVVQTTAADTFGVDTHRKGGSDETILMAELDRNDATVTVKSSSLFDASGEIHIGTECVAYTSKGSSTTFSGCTRGMYSPFAPEGSASDGEHFGEHHRVGFDAQSVKLQPVVSSIPRIWAGRRVGIWIHRVVNGVLDVKAQAHLVFSGRIVDIRDDPGSLGTIVECEHILDEIRESSIGHNLWSAKIKPGVYLATGRTFDMIDGTGASLRAANTLTVVASGAVGVNQINSGFYSHSEIFSKLETWWVAELAAARLYGAYSISISEWGGELRTKIFATISGTGSGTSEYYFRLPKVVAVLLGFDTAFNPSLASGSIEIHQYVTTGVEHTNVAASPPLKVIVLNGNAAIVQFDWNRVAIIEERGAFFDQYNFWPGAHPVPVPDVDDNWGIFLVGGKFMAFGSKRTMLDGSTQIGSLLPMTYQYTGALGADLNGLGSEPLSSVSDDGAIEIRQVMLLEGSLKDLLRWIFYSTGTASYNHTTYDVLPYGMGIGIPQDLLGIDFEASAAGLPGASNTTVILVDEPTTIAELFGGDFILRRAFTLWKEGHIWLGTWRAPTSGDATYTLSEDNKAEPAGSESNDQHRSATTQTTEWVRSIVKIDYNRDITASDSSGGYRDSITFEDSTAVDDAGGRAKLFTIKARNTYGQFAATGVGVNTLAPGFLSFLPMVSRPAWKIRRSIDCRFFEGLSVGDVVLFADEFARDPTTGTRGITARPALITMHKWSIGGSQGGDDTDPMGGEVELFFTDVNPTLQSAPYAPAADVDYTAITAGYDKGYSTSEVKLRCFPHHYSQTVEGMLDGSPIEIEDLYDAQRFATGHKVKIIERDPLDPASPLIWERTVSVVTGNDITLTSALSSPAWDNTRKYRVVFDDYDAAISAQHAWVFSADDVDGLIQDTAQPYLYGSGTPPGTFEANPAQSAQELVELVPEIVRLEGAGRDVGYEKQLIRLAENVIDYKTTCAPYLFPSVLTNTTNLTGFQLVAATPLYLMWELLSGAVRREISVAPMFRSSDGTQVFLRVSIYRDAPHDNTFDDQTPGIVGDGCVFITSSTTWQIPDPDILFAEVKDLFGNCWLQIECSNKCETRGLARFMEGPRST